jgi:hypothetical protein
VRDLPVDDAVPQSMAAPLERPVSQGRHTSLNSTAM